MVNEDFRQEMREIDVLCLMIHGDRDRSVPLEIAGKASADLLRNSRLLTYPGAPHGLMFTHMERLNADVQQLIRDTSAP